MQSVDQLQAFGLFFQLIELNHHLFQVDRVVPFKTLSCFGSLNHDRYPRKNFADTFTLELLIV